ncbi:MAG TPA: response regulator [Thermoanaerobaculia bacterium]|nr:response regulator [Thermoanaerobaculia bacterium]
MSESVPRTILLVDDDESFRARLACAFRERGFEVSEAADGRGARDLARAEAPELAVVDLRMPGESGLEILKALLAIEPAMRIVVLTGYGSIATALEAVRMGAVHYLTKPAYPDAILAAFEPGGAIPKADAGAEADADVESDVPSLARVEWEHLQRVLTDCGGNVSEAARRLGLHRRSLQRKLSKAPVRR